MLPSLVNQGSRCIEATARVVNTRLHTSFNSNNFLRFCSSTTSSHHHSQSCSRATDVNGRQDERERWPAKSKILNVPSCQITTNHPLMSSQFVRGVSVYYPLRQESKDTKDGTEEESGVDNREDDEGEGKASSNERAEKRQEREKEPVSRHLSKDRSKIIPVETSMRYLKSAAYKEAYGDAPVWVPYRRNFPGQFAPKKTRKTCIRQDKLSTGNPCPICRDEYLVVDYRNVGLLKQFISPFNGEVLGWDKTGVCRRRQEQLLIAIDKAKDYGLITFDVPFREYDYKEYEKIYASYK
ncbi:28S ribosomal protein S18b, mitochondrial [Orchesella cincta]|uniref:Small ribosomal subunit protein mS40 n=1 Tax=Orchesella cincta TaxID=48709 RepID=A0A1D2NMJ5_ORCCI|nr:28S ribosomal protein S18b, mitochondrial [Orchesella cincta]